MEKPRRFKVGDQVEVYRPALREWVNGEVTEIKFTDDNRVHAYIVSVPSAVNPESHEIWIDGESLSSESGAKLREPRDAGCLGLLILVVFLGSLPLWLPVS